MAKSKVKLNKIYHGVDAGKLRHYVNLRLRKVGRKFINDVPVCNCPNEVVLEEYWKIFGERPKIPSPEDKNKWEPKKKTNRVIKPKNIMVSSGGTVYVVGNLEHKVCKIGFSKQPKKRLAQIQTGCPFPVVMLAMFKGTMKTEKMLHRKYQAYKFRNNGEWFHLDEALEDAIRPHLRVKQPA